MKDTTEEQSSALEKLLRHSGTEPRTQVVAEAAANPGLWLGNLIPAFLTNQLAEIELVPWRKPSGALFTWSGLTIPVGEDLPQFIIDRDNPKTKLEVRWRTQPEHLPKGSVTYEVRVLAGEEILASRQLEHSERAEQKAMFTAEDFDELEESAKLEAVVELAALGQACGEPLRTEDFIVVFGETPPTDRVSSGDIFRCLADGLVQADTREAIEEFLSQRQEGKQCRPDKHGFLMCRLEKSRKGFRIERPRLLQEVERQWTSRSTEPIGRWTIRCRPDGFWTSSALEYVPLAREICPQSEWEKLLEVSRRFRDDAMRAGGVLSRFYLHGHSGAQLTADYLNAWQAALEGGSPPLALAHTIEVQSAAGRTLGLIVLPSHPLRVAWQSAYDALALHLRLEESLPVKRVRDDLSWLDAAHFPFVLPGVREGEAFVFGDVLGLCAVAMVLDTDREPKSAIATMAACFAGESERILPFISRSSGDALAKEVGHYIEAHRDCKLLRVHALRPGDGATVARALGRALKLPTSDKDTEDLDVPLLRDVAFRLEIHPSEAQSSVAGRHLLRLNQRRRAGVAAVSEEDSWCLESLPRGGGRTVPRLRWARREPGALSNPAHLAIAFDTFKSRVEREPVSQERLPLLAFGLIANVCRQFQFIGGGRPCWRLALAPEHDGEKLPDRVVSDRLLKLHTAILAAVARSAKGADNWPVLKTQLGGEDVELLQVLHRLCDWVVTVDRNAGIEYFDSPRDASTVYEAYVIDAVPERDDLGCLQMITSTAHFDEVRHLLDHTLALMGLSSSVRNCEFLLAQLKALSGRLAMRLAAGGDETVAARVGAELVALALARKKCLLATESDKCWLPLSKGFFVPLDDVRDLLPAATNADQPAESTDPNEPTQEDGRRADLLFVTVAGRGRLCFRFVEVKYRRHLAMARAAGLLEAVASQTSAARQQWVNWFFGESLTPTERNLRAARLCRVLRFYADKAKRHYLSEGTHQRLIEELGRFLNKPAEYQLASVDVPDRGYIFCPDYQQDLADELNPSSGEECGVWLFGPDTLPDKPASSPPAKPLPTDSATLPAAGDASPTATPQRPEPSAPARPADQLPAAGAGSETAGSAESRRAGESLTVVLGTAKGGEKVSWSPAIQGNPHLMVVGLPGMGKTTCLINICQHLVQGGIMPIVFSYHDDIDEKLAALFPELISSDCRSLGFNPMRVTQAGPLAHIESAGQLRDIFAAIFPDLGDLQLEQLRNAIKEAYREFGWGDEVASAAKPPPFRRFVEHLRHQPKPDARTQTLLARLNELDDFKFFRAEDGGSSLLDIRKPQVLRIHASPNEVVQRAYASFVLYRIYQDMFRRGRQERITHAVIFDEAHRASRLKLIPTMAKECRKYGLSMIVASQEARDFDVSLYSAIANYLILRVTDQDARALSRNVAPSEIERRVADRLKALPRYEALLFSEASRHPLQVRLAKATEP
ncbi:MAG: ATP-binding protein [Verrucomicrobia bacterium]|nr:ATP-binding protein [Verrucomicrobiota bacterium]